MTVYVDSARNKFRRMVMCHMVADTLPELHAMAGRLGMRREWFQGHASFPHYDLSVSRRELAIQYGARVVSRRELGEIMKRLRADLVFVSQWREWRQGA